MYLFLCAIKEIAENVGDVRSDYMTAIAITAIICTTIFAICLLAVRSEK
jgi:hypothetical protein